MRLELVYFDAGGGHRSAATALRESIHRQGFPWQVRLVNLQEILDPIDIVRRLAGLRLQDLYNAVLRNGWTLGARHSLKLLQAVIRSYHPQEVRLLREHWQTTGPDLVVSLIPHFNRAIQESVAAELPRTPFVTILTDLADYPPHFWIEAPEQYYICGSDRAVEQARHSGIPEARIFQASGMIVHPRFYDPFLLDRAAERRRLGLDPAMPVGLVMFGGQGSNSMLEIARRVEASGLPVQLLLLCGRNPRLAAALRQLPSQFPRRVEEFTTEVPYYMRLADFFMGKPGPGSISEALVMHLPVIVEENAWTLPQERYNAQWIREREVGLVVRSFRQAASAIQTLLSGGTMARFQANAAALRNRAVFEIPVMLRQILEEAAPPPAASGTSNVRASGTISMVHGSRPASSPST
ncbi:MAG TPA: glycosyltransferase [Terriglobia bacterium]|nr:glycosyltransferase [Terriglobia bacterium]